MVNYKIVPCNDVKLCSNHNDGCDYVLTVSLASTQNCRFKNIYLNTLRDTQQNLTTDNASLTLNEKILKVCPISRELNKINILNEVSCFV